MNLGNIKFYLLLIIVFSPLAESHTQVVINEFLASNTIVNVDELDYLDYNDWLEIYNPGEDPIDISGYGLTDDLKRPTKWKFPSGTIVNPKSFLMVWADDKNKNPGDTDTLVLTSSVKINISGMHTNFKISAQGGELGISDKNGTIVDQITYGKQLGNTSYGRSPINPEQWVYFGIPTPTTKNQSSPALNIITSSDVIHFPMGGVYSNMQTVQLTSEDVSDEIRYTLDGSVPKENSTLYTSPINVGTSTVIRSRSFSTGKIPGRISTESYLIEPVSSMPIISISTTNDDLWNLAYGIYQNSYKNREIPASIEMFNPDGQKLFGEETGIEIFGSNIFYLQQKPLSLSFKGKYGSSELAHPLFEERGEIGYKNFVLRNGGNDNGLTFFRDAFVMSLIKENDLNLDYQAFEPVTVYLNGAYWGIYNLREKLNEKYIAYLHDVNPAQINILEDSSIVKHGNDHEYRKFISFIENNDLSIQENYEYLATQLDLDSYLDYKILKIFIGYWVDLVNLKYWKHKEKGKWRYLAFDLEHSFGELSGDECTINTLEKVSSNITDLPDWSTLMFSKLLKNDTFRNEFVQRFLGYLETKFNPKNVLPIIDNLVLRYSHEMPRHIDKWNYDPMAIQSVSDWQNNIHELKEYINCRPSEIHKHLLDLVEETDFISIEVDVPTSDTARIYINEALLPPGLFTGKYIKNQATRITVVPSTEYGFLKWSNEYLNDTLNFITSRDTAFIPLFEKKSISVLTDTISSDTVLTISNSPYYIVRDIIIDSFVTVTIEKGVKIILSAKTNIVVYGSLVTEGTELQKVVFQNHPIPNEKENKWGSIIARNATGGTLLTHTDLLGSSYGPNRYKEKAAINSFNSTATLDQIRILDAVQPFYAEGGKIIINNSILRSETTGDLINIKKATNAIVENCDLRGNKATDTDAIDFDGVTDGIIRNNKIHHFYGYNSDGIDLGEACQNIAINENTILYCADKGISVGQASNCQISENLIIGCLHGIGVKDSGSIAELDHNTFFGNTTGISVYEKNAGEGGATINAKNTIFSNSRQASNYKDKVSNMTIDYCISDTDFLPGNHNIMADPKFKQASILNFELQTNSPCIDSGDPKSPLDPDQTITDMGAKFSFHRTGDNDIIINEINYNSGSGCDIRDWVELFNKSDRQINLKNWSFGTSEGMYHFKDNIFIQPEAYLVVCQDTSNFNHHYLSSIYTVELPALNLRNNGDQIILFNSHDYAVNTVIYKDQYPWPSGADGYCSTLELYDVQSDNSLPANWHSSYHSMGSPGTVNSAQEAITNIFINEFMAFK